MAQTCMPVDATRVLICSFPVGFMSAWVQGCSNAREVYGVLQRATFSLEQVLPHVVAMPRMEPPLQTVAEVWTRTHCALGSDERVPLLHIHGMPDRFVRADAHFVFTFVA